MNTTNNHLLNATLTLFDQMESIINQVHQDCYTKKISVLSDASIGQHFRHIIEFYQELIKGIPTAIINYENRKREIQIESTPSFAVNQIHELKNQVQTLHFSNNIFLHTRFSANTNESATVMPTSISRELMYAFDHAIHHLAIINIGLQIEFPYIEIPKNLGVAPSTLRYREECVH